MLGHVQEAVARLHGQWGVRRGDRVAWLGANHPDQLVLLFALAELGAMLVPLNFRLAAAEWDALLADCTPICIAHDAAWQDAAQALALRSGIVARSISMQGQAADPAQHGHDASRPIPLIHESGAAAAPALLVYTSGTTGRPKGAVHTQANLLANMRAACAAQQLTSADVVATVLPMFHVGGLCIQTLPALHAGASVILHPRFDPGATLDCFAQDRPSLTLLVPAVMKALIEHPGWAGADLSHLRAVWAGSSTLPQPLVEAFHARGVPVCNVYGATETGPFSIALAARHAISHAGSCGWPALDVQVRLEAVNGRPETPVGHSAGSDGAGDARALINDGVGQVLLRAPNVAQRYWPDVPAVDADGWFHTGDLARQAADGSYTVVGRIKDMIISGGENIYPAEIENLLAQHPWVLESAVVGMPDAQWGETVVAVVVLKPDAAYPVDWEPALQTFLQGRLARYKWPRRWQRMASLPKTALGKVQKPALLSQISGPPANGVWP